MTKLPKANKDLGQHFLTSTKVISKITNDFSEECDVIVEVGPGPAVLTPHLAAHGKPLYVIEKDSRFEHRLTEHVDPSKVFITDALKFDWDQFIADHKLENKKIWLVSNLPYNVGTILYTGFLSISHIKYMTLMFQKEVGDKTFVRDIKNEMNGLLFLSQNYFNAKLLKNVSPGCFTPPPRVDSVVVSYTRKEEPIISCSDFVKLNKFCRALFQFKRKQLGKVLKSTYPKELVAEALEKAGIESNLRAETLDFEKIYNLYNALK